MKTLEKRVQKAKVCKCSACGRWISNLVNVGGKIYGTSCSKKARIEIALLKEKEILLRESVIIELPSNAPLSEIREACSKGSIILRRPDGTTRNITSFIELELFPEVNMYYSSRKVG